VERIYYYFYQEISCRGKGEAEIFTLMLSKGGKEELKWMKKP